MQDLFLSDRKVFINGKLWVQPIWQRILINIPGGGYSREDYAFFDGHFDTEEVIVNGCTAAEIIGFSLTSFSVDAALELMDKIRVINDTAKQYGADMQ